MGEVNSLHVGIILDGNRRFARKNLMEPWKGHEYGAKKVEELLDWCKDLKVNELTLYAFSMQNFKRSKQEVKTLMKIFCSLIDKLLNEDLIEKLKAKFDFIGRLHLLPAELYRRIKKLKERTKGYEGLKVNLAIAYGGQEEIVDAVKEISKKIERGELNSENIDKGMIERNLYLKSQPDLIIRSGGDQRTSNFLIWQSWYSEWFFIKKTWPEFKKEDLIECIESFKSRERRYGK